MTTPEDHLVLARELLKRGDVVALLSSLQDFDRDLRRLTSQAEDAPVDPNSHGSYDSSQIMTCSDGSEAAWRRRVDSLRDAVDEILAACSARHQETLDELTTLRSQRQFQEPTTQETGHWFRGQA